MAPCFLFHACLDIKCSVCDEWSIILSSKSPFLIHTMSHHTTQHHTLPHHNSSRQATSHENELHHSRSIHAVQKLAEVVEESRYLGEKVEKK